MQIIDQKSMRVVWDWNKEQDQHLRLLYEKNLGRLMSMIEEKRNAGAPIPAADLENLSKEIQEAAELLNICTLNCYVLAQFAYIQAATSVEDQQKRHEWIAKLEAHVGGNVVVTDTSIPELQGEQVRLDALLGVKAVVNHDGQQYETPMERVALVLGDQAIVAPAPAPAPEPPPPPPAPAVKAAPAMPKPALTPQKPGAPATPPPVKMATPPAAKPATPPAPVPVVAAPPPAAAAAAKAPSGPAPLQLKIVGKPKEKTGDLAVLKPRLTDTQLLGKKAGLKRPPASGVAAPGANS